MEALIIVMLLAVIGLGAIALAFLSQRRPPTNPVLDQHLAALRAELAQANASTQQAVGQSERTVLQQVSTIDVKMNQRLDSMQNTVDQRLNAVDNRLGQSMTSHNDTIGKIGEQLGELSKSTQQMIDVGKNISSLQDILRPPKMRGGFGEMLLERLLAEVLPEQSFSTQHRFPNGAIVDAAIRVGDNVIPVDSKFPLESFHRMMQLDDEEARSAARKEFVRAVRGHVDSVTKYILPDEGGLPFVLMYIPAENVYYEVAVKDDFAGGPSHLSTYAMERRVIFVSPNSFYAYLQAILVGLKGMQVEERAQEIIGHLERLNADFLRLRKDFGLVGTHLKNASDRYSDVDRSFSKFGDRLSLTLHEPMQQSLPEPQEVAAQSTLPRPASVGNGNGHDDL